MKRILCHLFGHKWEAIGFTHPKFDKEAFECKRCGKTKLEDINP